MILQGDEDKDVNIEQNKEIVKNIPNGKLKIIKGANHVLSVNGDYSESIKLLKEFFTI